MPQDKNGEPIAVGDLVNVPCRIVNGYEGNNHDVIVVAPVNPTHHQHSTAFTLDSIQVEKLAEPTPEPEPPAEPADDQQ